MTPTEMRSFVTRWLCAVTAGNSSEFSHLVSADVRDLNGNRTTGAGAFEARARAVQAAFSDLKAELDELVIEGDRIAWRWRLTGIQRGAFLGQPASGARITLRGVNFQRLENGRVTEHYTLIDVQQALLDMHAASAARD